MAEYITKNQAYHLICKADKNKVLASKELYDIKPANVVEREKIDKAIEEIEQYLLEEECNANHEKGVMFALEILKRNIGESKSVF